MAARKASPAPTVLWTGTSIAGIRIRRGQQGSVAAQRERHQPGGALPNQVHGMRVLSCRIRQVAIQKVFQFAQAGLDQHKATLIQRSPECWSRCIQHEWQSTARRNSRNLGVRVVRDAIRQVAAGDEPVALDLLQHSEHRTPFSFGQRGAFRHEAIFQSAAEVLHIQTDPRAPLNRHTAPSNPGLVQHFLQDPARRATRNQDSEHIAAQFMHNARDVDAATARIGMLMMHADLMGRNHRLGVGSEVQGGIHSQGDQTG